MMRILPKTSVIRLFDPWRSPLCTCPIKYTINPYTGCAHACLYCYARSYIKDFIKPRPKLDLAKRFIRDLLKIPTNSLMELSASSDPYTPQELRLQLTRSLLKLILRYRKGSIRVLIVTKSDIVLRDVDIIKELRSTVAITITTLNSDLAKVLEPNAPDPHRRLEAVRILSNYGIPVVVRVDPIIPFVNDSVDELKELIDKVSEAGVVQIISSTYKAKPDSLRRLMKALPKVSNKLRDAYLIYGTKIHGSIYLDRTVRLGYMTVIKQLSEKQGLAFTTCREGLQHLNTPGIYCDGSTFTYKEEIMAPGAGFEPARG